jgi:hypothetical protein
MSMVKYLWSVLLLAPAAAASAAAAGPEPGQTPVSEVHAEAAPRVEWFWIKAAAGYQALNLRTFDAGEDDFTIGLIPESKAGPTVDVGLGARLLFVTLGARFTGGFFRDDSEERTLGGYQLWSLDGELGVRLPFGRVEPYVQVSAGYSSLGGLGDALEGLRRGVDIAGLNTRLAFGFDVYLNRRLSLGLRGTGELLFLSRRGVPVRDLLEPRQVDTLGELRTRLLEANGSTVGTALSLYGNIGVHF